MEIQPIAYFHSPFPSKFGIPKQSGLVEELQGKIVFVPDYRNRDALRGIDKFDYLWLIWEFSANRHAPESPVVRPPLLGGNERVGVFATRSPFRPNRLGLSSVRLLSVEWDTHEGPLIHVAGADLMDGTPIYDIKPYVVFADSHPHASSGFVDHHSIRHLQVEIPDEWQSCFSAEELPILYKILELDPRPPYQNDSDKVYGMPYGSKDIHFRVTGNELIVVNVTTIEGPK
jgi:tRNA (adenine37-N6)-methyltransferase